MDDPRRRRCAHRPRSERWGTFIRNHAETLLACDFAVEMLAGGRMAYIFVVMHVASRRILHTNVTQHPTSAWIAQQLREAIPHEHGFTHLLHDHDASFSRSVDATIRSFGIEPILTPIRSPVANAFIERRIGTLRRECLDFLLPLNEHQLARATREWNVYYNRGRPHTSLGPGVPEPTTNIPAPERAHRHRLEGAQIISTPVLGGIHHDDRLAA